MLSLKGALQCTAQIEVLAA